MRRLAAVAMMMTATPVLADSAASCGGFAELGGAVLTCTMTEPKAPAQFCTFSWALMTTAGTPSIAQGTFLLPPGSNGAIVYQGTGFASALSNPIVLCQGRKADQ